MASSICFKVAKQATSSVPKEVKRDEGSIPFTRSNIHK